MSKQQSNKYRSITVHAKSSSAAVIIIYLLGSVASKIFHVKQKVFRRIKWRSVYKVWEV